MFGYSVQEQETMDPVMVLLGYLEYGFSNPKSCLSRIFSNRLYFLGTRPIFLIAPGSGCVFHS
jgi:hypothetical protein